MPKKKKHARDAESDPEPEELEPEENEHNETPPKKKKKKKEVQHTPEPEPEDEDMNSKAEVAKKLRTSREHKRLSGYRSVAKECGFLSNSGSMTYTGIDSFASCISSTDAKRLMRFVPEVLNKSSYDKHECAERMKLSQESVPGSAARETQARCEAVFRHVLNEAVMRTVEANKIRVDAATMHSVLRKYANGMTFTSITPPKGLIRHAQAEGKLGAFDEDAQEMSAEKEENKHLENAAAVLAEKEEARIAAFRERKKQLIKEREKMH